MRGYRLVGSQGHMTTAQFRSLSELEGIALAAVERGEWDNMGSINDEALAFDLTFPPGEVLRLVRNYRAMIRASMKMASAGQTVAGQSINFLASGGG